MQAIEFECQALEGIIKVPEQFQEWYGQPVKVILLRSEEYLTLPQENPAIATASYLSLMKQYSYAQPGHYWSREELNER